MRVDVIAEFYVRVGRRARGRGAAAQTLGQRTLEPEQLKELLEGKFVDALRTSAAEMTMEELHEKRGAYVSGVRESVAGDLTRTGLELEAASLTQLDQTAMEYFQPQQRLRRRGPDAPDRADRAPQKQRNDVEQDTLIAIRNKNLEAEKFSLKIDRESEYARLAQEARRWRSRRARQRSELDERTRPARAGRRERADQAPPGDRGRHASARSRRSSRSASPRTRHQARDRGRQALELAGAAARHRGRPRKARPRAKRRRQRIRRGPWRSRPRRKVFTAVKSRMAERRKAIELDRRRRTRNATPCRSPVGPGRESRSGDSRRRRAPAGPQATPMRTRFRAMASKVRSRSKRKRCAMLNEGAQRAVAGGNGPRRCA
jgi:hypothetical protein